MLIMCGMKVLLIITHGSMGGAGIMVLDLARGLKAQGVDVTVGFGKGEYLERRLNELGIPRVRFASLARSRNIFSIPLFVLEIRKFLKKNRFDAVQFNSSNTLAGCFGAKLSGTGVRTVFTIHGLSVLDRHYASPFLKLPYWAYFKVFLPFADEIVFVSQDNLREARLTGLTRRGRVIYNGMDPTALTYWTKEKARAELETITGQSFANAYLIGSIGRLSYQKNYSFLIRTLPQILSIQPTIRCVLIGEGKKRALYERLIKKYRLESICFLAGGLEDAARLLKAFDLFVLPSRYEGLPITLVECLFADVPMLVTDVNGNKEIVEKENRYKMDDTKDFIQKFSGIVSRPQVTGYESLKSKFMFEKMTHAYTSLFKKP